MHHITWDWIYSQLLQWITDSSSSNWYSFTQYFQKSLIWKGARGNWPRSETRAIHESKVKGERVLIVNKDIYYFLRKSQLMQGYSSCKQNHRKKKKKSHICEICFSSVHSVKIWNVQYDRSEAAWLISQKDFVTQTTMLPLPTVCLF